MTKNLLKMHNFNSCLLFLVAFSSLFMFLVMQVSLTTASIPTIGVILDQTSRPGKEAKVAIEIAIKDFNNETVLYLQNNPVYAAIAAKTLIDNHKVKAILGGYTWEEASVMAEVISEADHDIPVFLSLAVPTQSTHMNAIAAILQSLGIRQVTIIYETSSSASIISHFSQAFRRTGGELMLNRIYLKKRKPDHTDLPAYA